MKGPPADFWGKLERDPATQVVEEWHPLIDHCADVAACAAALLQLSTWRQRLARFCERRDLDDVTCARLCVLAALHDVGKFNIGFQAKGNADLGATAGHVREALAAIGRDVLESVDPLGSWGEGTTGLLVAAICHHGRPYNYQVGVFEAALWQPGNGYDPGAGVEALVGATHKWFPLAFSKDGQELPRSPEFEHAFAGLVMLADWLGSDRSVFPYSNSGDPDRMAFARGAAGQLLADIWLEVGETRRSDRADQTAFSRVADPEYEIRPAQAVIAGLPEARNSSVAILESETGSGKTEAALAHFVALFSRGAVDGMYLALPTRTAATQMYKRVLEAARRAFKEPPPVIQAVPGYLRVDDIKGERKLAGFGVLWPDGDEKFRYRAWAGENAKRYLAGCIVVGTIDQVLLSSLRVGHAHLRATALLRQLLVVDEVHASDTYMMRLLENVLARHVGAGGHALLLSATLTAESRLRLLSPGESVGQSSIDEAIAVPYPLVSYRTGPDILVRSAGPGQSRVVDVQAVPWLESSDAIAASAVEAARLGAKVLVVRNTVTDCIETQLSLEQIADRLATPDVLFSCRGVPAPHHSRYARVDREALDAALEARIGKDRPDGGCVVVATQTVQQSLDIDVDFLLTDLCPMDVLLQRIGRLHRHARERPEGFNEARVIVLVPGNSDLGTLLNTKGRARHHHGLGTVYPDLRVLTKTWHLVAEASRWTIPDMNRALVEGSLHTTALKAASEAGDERWQLHAAAMVGTQRGDARLAELNVVDWTKPYSETTFSDDQRIPTRLGEGDRRVQFPDAVESPFGFSVRELTIPGRWGLQAAALDHVPHTVVHAAGVTRFKFGGRSFIYDRHGLRLETPHSGDADDDGA